MAPRVALVGNFVSTNLNLQFFFFLFFGKKKVLSGKRERERESGVDKGKRRN